MRKRGHEVENDWLRKKDEEEITAIL